MSKLPKQKNKNIIVGYENADDAGVFRLNNELALVQTVDFFTPIADDPKIYGKIAAVNSLNDIYAMGGTPITALTIVAFPKNGNLEILSEIMRGGQETLNTEEVAILGGHSVDDKEIKFGYGITGIINPKKIIKNSGAKIGDVLILTKPIGTGIISTGIKFGKTSRKTENAAIKIMTKSAREASQSMQKIGANACTDITGFGFLGHTYEMAKASKLTFKIKSQEIPLLPDVMKLIEEKMLTGADKTNREYVEDTIRYGEKVNEKIKSALFDPQTAGGLLISMEEKKAEKFLKKIQDAKIVGKVEKKCGYWIEVI